VRTAARGALPHSQCSDINYASGVRDMGMRRIAVLLLSIAGALIMGLIWTVGQTGLSDTNAHLCELFSRYLPDVSENCQASDWIVSGAGYLSDKLPKQHLLYL
jgi:hypothetical protein